ncbi:hypothetical protein, partial [Streptomyces sp. SID3343]|uniref:hypothetical protein n=1 Tax=Streptomyces sp. SID3343 TaxID=2690260 RepID=UPI001F3843C3
PRRPLRAASFRPVPPFRAAAPPSRSGPRRSAAIEGRSVPVQVLRLGDYGLGAGEGAGRVRLGEPAQFIG